MSDAIAFTNCQAILPNEVIANATVRCESGRIVEIQRASKRTPIADEIIDCNGGFLSPGFVDIHVHGAAGYDFMDGTLEAVTQICHAHALHGTTSIFPTTTTGAKDVILQTIASCKEYQKQFKSSATKKGSRLQGIHLYGPYFAQEKVGCHDPTQCRSPQPAEFDDYFATKLIRIATCAAELPGATDFYKNAKRKKCLVTCGHSNASWSEMASAFKCGMRHVDHFWCAMSMVNSVRTRLGVPMQGSMLEFVLANEEMSTEVIADGCHLAPELLYFAYKMKGARRLCLVTDCSRALDMPPGDYRFGSYIDGPMFHSDGKVGWAGNGSLASSVRGMDHMVRHAYKTMQAPLHDVIRMASLTPAELTGIDQAVGSIAVGKKADLVLLSKKLAVQKVYIDGLRCR